MLIVAQLGADPRIVVGSLDVALSRQARATAVMSANTDRAPDGRRTPGSSARVVPGAHFVDVVDELAGCFFACSRPVLAGGRNKLDVGD